LWTALSLVSCFLLDFSFQLMRAIMLVMSWKKIEKKARKMGKNRGGWRACESESVCDGSGSKWQRTQCWHKQTPGHLSALEWLQRQQQRTHKDLPPTRGHVLGPLNRVCGSVYPCHYPFSDPRPHSLGLPIIRVRQTYCWPLLAPLICLARTSPEKVPTKVLFFSVWVGTS